jgi:hypothetical protein
MKPVQEVFPLTNSNLSVLLFTCFVRFFIEHSDLETEHSVTTVKFPVETSNQLKTGEALVDESALDPVMSIVSTLPLSLRFESESYNEIVNPEKVSAEKEDSIRTVKVTENEEYENVSSGV